MKNALLPWAAAMLCLWTTLPGSTACMKAGMDCSSEALCCSDMHCKKVGASDEYGKCQSSQEKLETFDLQVWADKSFTGQQWVHHVQSAAFGTCFNVKDEVRDKISSLKWTDSMILIVYDQRSCIGHNHVIYSSAPYMYAVGVGGTVKREGFLGGFLEDLSSVCMLDRCGSTSSVNLKSLTFAEEMEELLNTNNVTAVETDDELDTPDCHGCDCDKTWNDKIRSYRVFRRARPDTMRVIPF